MYSYYNVAHTIASIFGRSWNVRQVRCYINIYSTNVDQVLKKFQLSKRVKFQLFKGVLDVLL